jgi:hypothetical protein
MTAADSRPGQILDAFGPDWQCLFEQAADFDHGLFLPFEPSLG